MRRARARGPVRAPFHLTVPNLINPKEPSQDTTLTRHRCFTVSCGTRMASSPTFDAPGAGTGAGQGTQSFAISSRWRRHGVLLRRDLRDSRVPAGCESALITTFDLPGGGTAPVEGTYGGGFAPKWKLSLESSSTRTLLIMGSCWISMAQSQRSMLQTRVQASIKAHSLGGSIPNRAITGWYVDNANVSHGFVRDKNGVLTEFDVPGAGPLAGHCSERGGDRSITSTPNGVVHGFCANRSHWTWRTLNGRNSWVQLRHNLPESSPTRD